MAIGKHHLVEIESRHKASHIHHIAIHLLHQRTVQVVNAYIIDFYARAHHKVGCYGIGVDCTIGTLHLGILNTGSNVGWNGRCTYFISWSTIEPEECRLGSTQIDRLIRATIIKYDIHRAIIRRKGRTAKAQSNSLPAGILKDIGFDKAQITLKNEDIVLMMSDGVINDGTDWICDFLVDYEGTAQQLADNIATMARRRKQDFPKDDITVMAAIIKKV